MTTQPTGYLDYRPLTCRLDGGGRGVEGVGEEGPGLGRVGAGGGGGGSLLPFGLGPGPS